MLVFLNNCRLGKTALLFPTIFQHMGLETLFTKWKTWLPRTNGEGRKSLWNCWIHKSLLLDRSVRFTKHNYICLFLILCGSYYYFLYHLSCFKGVGCY